MCSTASATFAISGRGPSRHGPRQPFLERPARDVFQDQVKPGVCLPDVVQRDDVGMSHARISLCFLEPPLSSPVIGAWRVWHDFQRDLSSEPLIGSQVDDTRRTTSDLAFDRETRDSARQLGVGRSAR